MNTFYRDEGSGAPIVLVHGVGLDHTMWDEHVARLGGRFRIIRPDLLGHGETPRREGELSLDSFADQLGELVGHLRLEQFSLAGFSLGALVVQKYALRRPSGLHRLILFNSVHARTPEQLTAIRARFDDALNNGTDVLIDGALARWFTDDYTVSRPEVIAAVRRRLQRNDPLGFLAAYRVFIEADAELAGELSRIAVPTLVMTGGDDVGSTPAMSQAIAAEIEAAELRVVAGAKHMLPVECASLVCEAIEQFLPGESVQQATSTTRNGKNQEPGGVS